VAVVAEAALYRKILIALSVIGLIDAAYLTYFKYDTGGVCLAGGGCDVVNSSVYSMFGGVPIALLGAIAYIVMLGILLLESQVDFFEVNGPLMVFAISLFGVLYSAYLTYLELFVINAICPFCVVSAIVLVLMLLVSTIRIRQGAKTA
jgi:uncharacterized membrane protein